MCLEFASLAQTAAADIVVYKVLRKYKKIPTIESFARQDLARLPEECEAGPWYYTPYRARRISLGLTYSEPEMRRYPSPQANVHIGLHAFKTLEAAIAEVLDWPSTCTYRIIVIKCTIPAGSTFHTGIFPCAGKELEAIVSDALTYGTEADIVYEDDREPINKIAIPPCA